MFAMPMFKTSSFKAILCNLHHLLNGEPQFSKFKEEVQKSSVNQCSKWRLNVFVEYSWSNMAIASDYINDLITCKLQRRMVFHYSHCCLVSNKLPHTTSWLPICEFAMCIDSRASWVHLHSNPYKFCYLHYLIKSRLLLGIKIQSSLYAFCFGYFGVSCYYDQLAYTPNSRSPKVFNFSHILGVLLGAQYTLWVSFYNIVVDAFVLHNSSILNNASKF